MTELVVVATVAGIMTVVVVAMIALQRFAVRLQRAERKVRLLHLWSRERRADLARLVSLWIAGDESDPSEAVEDELKKQAQYVGIEWSRTPTPAPGFMNPEKLTSAELLELLDLSREIGSLS